MLKWMTIAALASVALPADASAQSDIGLRVGKLEGEMRAVQRKVFPGGAGDYLQPAINDQAAAAPVPGTPSSSPLVDLDSRVASLESQMASLTGQIEQTGYKLRQLQEQFDAYRRTTDAKLGGGAPVGGVDAPPPLVGDAGARRVMPLPAARAGAMGDTSAPTAAKPAAAADPAVAAVERPSTGDPAEDDYIFGYRLWQAKQYPAAEVQLKKVVAAYPANRRASYAQNLLGRAYLDEGKPSLASMAFYDNYKKMPDGERAPDSLYYLAQALMKLDKPADACKVYGELTEVYGAKISTAMKADVARGRAAAKCQ